MAKKLVAYNKQGEKLATGEPVESGKATVQLTGLTPETTYAKGDYQVAIDVDGREGSKVDVPEFTTQATPVAEPENVEAGETTDTTADISADV